MTTLNPIVSSQASIPTERKSKGRGGNIVVGAVVKSKIGQFEEELMAGNSRRMRKELNGWFKVYCGGRGSWRGFIMGVKIICPQINSPS